MKLSPILNFNYQKNTSFCAKKNLHTKKAEELTFSEKMEILRGYGFTKDEVLHASKQNGEYINQLITIKKHGARNSTALIFAGYSPEDFKKVLDLIEREVEISFIPQIL